MRHSEEIRHILAQHDLFASLAEPALARLADETRVVELRPDQVLFNQGDPADRFFLMYSGQVKLFRVTPEGHEKVMEIMGPGRTFGEAIMFMEQHSYPVTAQALRDSRLLAIPSRAYLQLLSGSPETCFRLLGQLSMRLHQRLNEIENLSVQNASYRVARYLLRRLPVGAGDGTEIQLDAPKQVIASQLGMKPETFSRVLGTLAQHGAISVKGRTVRIEQIAMLAGD